MINQNKVISLRKQRNWTQQQLADKIGISRSSLGMFETGNRDLDSDVIVKMANVFNVTTDYLLDVPTRRPEELPVFDETLDKETAVKLVKDYIMSQSDWSEERKQMNIKQIDLMFGDE